jgi:hypothetical protein
VAARKSDLAAIASIAEQQIIALYDAGVLSPAVLHHVIAPYAQSGIDWSEAGTHRTVDDHSMQEAVVLIMMPGRPLRTAKKDFLSVVEHLAGNGSGSAKKSTSEEHEEDAEDDEDLLSQLGGKRASPKKKDAKQSAKKPAGFNPLVGARAVGKR